MFVQVVVSLSIVSKKVKKNKKQNELMGAIMVLTQPIIQI